MALRRRHILGLAFGERSLHVAEVWAAGSRRSIRRAAVFEFPAGMELGEAERVGRALRAFLRERGFEARRAVVGLPARWLTSRRLEAPPAEPAMLASVLRIQAERAFGGDVEELVLDYVRSGASAEEGAVLAVAALRRRLEQVRAVAAAAGLRVMAALPSAVALALSGDEGGSDAGAVVALTPREAELAVWRARQVSGIRHVPLGAGGDADSVDALAAELRRALLTDPDASMLGPDARLRLWDGWGLDDEARRRLAQGIEVGRVERGRLAAMADVNGAALDDAEHGRFAAAVAVAIVALGGAGAAIDLLRPKLAAPKRTRFDRRRRLGALVAAAVAAAIGWLVWAWWSEKQQVTELVALAAAQAPDLEAAARAIERVRFAEGWFDRRPAHLECLRAITLAFPEDDGIRATGLTLRESMQGVLIGRANGEAAVLGLMDRLSGSERFAAVKLLYMNEAGRGQREIAFAVEFRFVAGGGP